MKRKGIFGILLVCGALFAFTSSACESPSKAPPDKQAFEQTVFTSTTAFSPVVVSYELAKTDRTTFESTVSVKIVINLSSLKDGTNVFAPPERTWNVLVHNDHTHDIIRPQLYLYRIVPYQTFTTIKDRSITTLADFKVGWYK